MICNTIGLTVDSFTSIYMTGGAEVEEVYGAINYGEPIYAKIREITGIPPLYFTSRTADSLTDYRIYGETLQDGTPSPDYPVDVVGVGERTENLFDKDTAINGYSINSITGELMESTIGRFVSDFIPCNKGILYTIANGNRNDYFWEYNAEKIYTGRYLIVHSFTAAGDGYIRISNSADVDNVMLVEGSTTPTSFIPYGYKIPVTTTNGTDTVTTPVYIGDTQLMADEYVSFDEQKIYKKVNGVLTPTNPPVPLHAIPTLPGVNTITVDTTVPPSQMSIKGKIKPDGYGKLTDKNGVYIHDKDSTPLTVHGQGT